MFPTFPTKSAKASKSGRIGMAPFRGPTYLPMMMQEKTERFDIFKEL